jgi:hypothetical protein
VNIPTQAKTGLEWATRDQVPNWESRGTARREQLGVYPVVRRRHVSLKARPLSKNARRAGHPLLCVSKAWASTGSSSSVRSVAQVSEFP